MLSTYLYNLTNEIWHQKIFSILTLLSLLSFLSEIIGIYHIPHNYDILLHKIITYYIIAVLTMRFNPWVNKTVYSKVIAEYDRKLSFTSGMVLLTTNILNAKH